MNALPDNAHELLLCLAWRKGENEIDSVCALCWNLTLISYVCGKKEEEAGGFLFVKPTVLCEQICMDLIWARRRTLWSFKPLITPYSSGFFN